MFHPSYNNKYSKPYQRTYVTYRNQENYRDGNAGFVCPGKLPEEQLNEYSYNYKKSNVPSDNNNNNEIPRIPRSYGDEEKFDFGKYNGLTCYDVANMGDFKYLNWLNRGKFNGDFNLNAKTRIHITTSLQTSNYKNALWEKKEDNNSYWYEFSVEGQIVKSPIVQKSTVNITDNSIAQKQNLN